MLYFHCRKSSLQCNRGEARQASAMTVIDVAHLKDEEEKFWEEVYTHLNQKHPSMMRV
jgi:hypothetical protein